MSKRLVRIISLLLSFCLLFEQSGFSQVANQLDISGHLLSLRNSFTPDKFRPLHLRFISYDLQANNFQLLLDKGNEKGLDRLILENSTKTLLNYFFVGISLPNDCFWVNLRPDSPTEIIDEFLAKTDVGKILLEADLQLKKDTAKFTSPQNPQGKEYWDKLYKKAAEIFGHDNITIPTLTRPWIVPDEIILREAPDSAYIYKATLKVMLEEDYLKDSVTYNFKDPKLKELNEYSSQLIRELIIPKLTKEVNTAKRYAPLRQIYYSLILAQWFKQRFYGRGGLYSWLIDKKNLNGLTSKKDWSKTTFFKAYQKSFKSGEYNLKEPIYTPYGQTIRSYMSGGIGFAPDQGGTGGIIGAIKEGSIPGDKGSSPLYSNNYAVDCKINGGNPYTPWTTKVTIADVPLPATASPGTLKEPEDGPVVDVQSTVETDLSEKIEAILELIRSKRISGDDLFLLFKKFYRRWGTLDGLAAEFLRLGLITKRPKTWNEKKIFGKLSLGLWKKLRELPRAEDILDGMKRKNIDEEEIVFLIKDAKTFSEVENKFKEMELILRLPANKKERKEFVELVGDIWFVLAKKLAKGLANLEQPEMYLTTEEKIRAGDWPAFKATLKLKSRSNKSGSMSIPVYLHGINHPPRVVLEIPNFFRFMAGSIFYYEQNFDFFDKLPRDGTEINDHELAKKYFLKKEIELRLIQWTFLFLGILFLPVLIVLFVCGNMIRPHGGEEQIAKFELFIQEVIYNILCRVSRRAYNPLRLSGKHIRADRLITVMDLAMMEKGDFAQNLLSLVKEAYFIFIPRFLRFDEISYITGKKDAIIRSRGRSLLQLKFVLDDLLDKNVPPKATTKGIHLLLGINHALDIEFLIKNPDCLDNLLSKINNREIEKTFSILDRGVEKASRPTDDITTDNFITSSAISQGDKKGGVDFRTLPIPAQPLETIPGQLPLEGTFLLNFNLNEEWQEIENLLERGIIPSTQHIKEYLLACLQKSDFIKETEKVLSCIADILRLEEEYCSFTEPALREILVLLESDKPVSELQVVLNKITVLPKEPKRVIP